MHNQCFCAFFFISSTSSSVLCRLLWLVSRFFVKFKPHFRQSIWSTLNLSNHYHHSFAVSSPLMSLSSCLIQQTFSFFSSFFRSLFKWIHSYSFMCVRSFSLHLRFQLTCNSKLKFTFQNSGCNADIVERVRVRICLCKIAYSDNVVNRSNCQPFLLFRSLSRPLIPPWPATPFFRLPTYAPAHIKSIHMVTN